MASDWFKGIRGGSWLVEKSGLACDWWKSQPDQIRVWLVLVGCASCGTWCRVARTRGGTGQRHFLQRSVKLQKIKEVQSKCDNVDVSFKNKKIYMNVNVWKLLMSTYLLELVDLSDKEISIATGNLCVCNMDHILMEDQVNSLLAWLTSKNPPAY